MFGLGMQEILVIAMIIQLLSGGKKISENMTDIGNREKSCREGMNEVTDLKEEKKEETRDE